MSFTCILSLTPSPEGRTYPCYYRRGMLAQRGQTTCPRPHSEVRAESEGQVSDSNAIRTLTTF